MAPILDRLPIGILHGRQSGVGEQSEIGSRRDTDVGEICPNALRPERASRSGISGQTRGPDLMSNDTVERGLPTILAAFWATLHPIRPQDRFGRPEVTLDNS